MSMLKGKRIYLRQPEPADAKLWNEWLNDFDVVLPLGDEVYGKITKESLCKQIEDYANSDYYMFTIMTLSNKPIGRCILFSIDRINGKGSVGIFIGDKEEWGKGYAKEALQLLIEYAFRIQNLHSVLLGVFEFNIRAINLYNKVGFKQVGIRRDARKINGKYHNVILMDLLEHEYENKFLDFSILK